MVLIYKLFLFCKDIDVTLCSLELTPLEFLPVTVTWIGRDRRMICKNLIRADVVLIYWHKRHSEMLFDWQETQISVIETQCWIYRFCPPKKTFLRNPINDLKTNKLYFPRNSDNYCETLEMSAKAHQVGGLGRLRSVLNEKKVVCWVAEGRFGPNTITNRGSCLPTCGRGTCTKSTSVNCRQITSAGWQCGKGGMESFVWSLKSFLMDYWIINLLWFQWMLTSKLHLARKLRTKLIMDSSS